MTNWTEKRLARLFATYNARYWRGRVPHHDVRIAVGEGPYGRCDFKKRDIWIHVTAHKSDREVRSTVLHEMAHAAGPDRSSVSGHGYKFWAQIERLLRQGANVTVGNSEAPEARVMTGAVPRKFPLARKAMDRADVARQREILRRIKGRPIRQLTKGEIMNRCEDLAPQCTWRIALIDLDDNFQLLDVGGRPRSRWSARIMAEAKRKFDTARRSHLAYEKRRKEIERIPIA